MKKMLLRIKNYFTNNPSKKYTLMSLIISVVLVIGASYALVTSDLFMGKRHSIIAGKLVITFAESNGLFTLNNSIPLTDAQGIAATDNTYSFTIRNTGNVDASYRIKVLDETLSANKLDVEKIRYSLRINDGDWILPAKLFNSDLGRTLWDGYIDVGEVLDIDVKFWIDIETTSADIGKVFNGKISVNSVQLVEDGYTDVLGPTINLVGNANVNLIQGATYTEEGVASVTDPVEGSLLTNNVKLLYEYYDGEVYQKVQSIDTSKKGVYFITYSIANAVGNVGSSIRIVTVSTNSSLPTISLTGDSDISSPRGILYSDLGATATDTSSNSLTSSIKKYGFVNPNVGGEYNLKYAVKDANDNYSGIVRKVKVLWARYVYNYSGNYQKFTAPYTGWYKIEAWGAQGGGIAGALGGYTSGKTYLTQGEQLYVYVGEKPATGTGGYNGGGNAYQLLNGGGGATDIRYFGSENPSSTVLTWNSPIGLNSRIMVAGAGGGNIGHIGGAGGNLIGETAYSSNFPEYTSGGGKQTSGGVVNNYNGSYPLGTDGTFGVGGTGGGAANASSSGGGGGGYYAGAGGSRLSSGSFPAGGGSSFISGYAGVAAIIEGSTTTPARNHIDSNGLINTKHYSDKYFIDTEMQHGINNGNGKATIKYLGTPEPIKIKTTLNSVRYIKDCINGSDDNAANHWVEIQAIKDGINLASGKLATGILNRIATPIKLITDGDINSSHYASDARIGNQCVVIDLEKEYDLDEIAVWHYWDDGRTYNSNITSVSGSNKIYRTAIDKNIPESSEGKRTNAYTYGLYINPNGGTYIGKSGISTYNLASNLTMSISHPIRLGYIFNGWTIEAGTGSNIVGSTFTMGTRDTVITARWSLNSAELTVYVNGGLWSGTTVQELQHGQTVVIADPTKTGYTFTGWTVEGTESSYNSQTKEFTMGIGAASIIANWTENQYLLTVVHDGSYSGSTPMTINYNSTITIPDPTKVGHTFTGWTVEGAGSSYDVATKKFTMGYEAATLTANWTTNTYTVTLNNQSATTAGTTSVTATYGSALPTITKPTKTGYTFGGYYTQTGGGGTQYYTAAGASTINWNLTSATTLYAKWTANTYAVAYNCNGGAGSTSPGSHAYGVAKALSNNGCFKITAGASGMVYSFSGWATSPEGAVVYGNQQSVSNLSSTQGATVTLYAKWSDLFSYPGTYVVENDSGSNWIIRLKTVGAVNFTMNATRVVDVWLVGGGGGGGYVGGGGGGGYTNIQSSVTLNAGTTYTTTVGAGGAAQAASASDGKGANGGTSTLKLGTNLVASCTAAGGVGGNGESNGWASRSGGAGGSGGGGYYNASSSTTGVSVGGYNGNSGQERHAPGGVGLGETTCEFRQGTAGAASCNSASIPMYSGGGAGGAYYADNRAAGVAGGGGGVPSPGIAGVANTGGGGAGGYSSSKVGGAGGSGIVVIRNHR